MLLTAQGCARLHTGLIITQIPWGYPKKSLLFRKPRYVRALGEETSFLAFPEAKKGVVSCARLRKAAHWPNSNANPLGLSEKKVYCVEKRDVCDT